MQSDSRHSAARASPHGTEPPQKRREVPKVARSQTAAFGTRALWLFLSAHAPEIHLEIRRVHTERFAWSRPRHCGAARERHDTIVVADERANTVRARRAGHSVLTRIPAR